MANDPAAPPPEPWSAPRRLYPRLLGTAWRELAQTLQRVHADASIVRAEGVFQVSRAPGRLAGLILDAVGVPRASDAAEVRLAVCQRGAAEHWHRIVGGRKLVTVQTEAPGGILAERIGVLEFRFRLAVADGDLLFRQEGLRLALGSLRLSLPTRLSPQIAAREGPTGDPDRTRVEVRVTSPSGSLFFSYRGTVRWSP
jgi:hypothetical protein